MEKCCVIDVKVSSLRHHLLSIHTTPTHQFRQHRHNTFPWILQHLYIYRIAPTFSEIPNRQSKKPIVQIRFNFAGYGALAFTERLSIWCPIIRGLAISGFGRYVDIVQLLVLGILRKMQFRFDQDAELDVLDNESLDDDVSCV